MGFFSSSSISLSILMAVSIWSQVANAEEAAPPAGSSDAVLKDIDQTSSDTRFDNITEAQLICLQGNRTIAGVQPCGQFKGKVVANVKERLDTEFAKRYEGLEIVDWVTGETKGAAPVCNLLDGEIERNSRNGRSCGELCNVRVSGYSPSPKVNVEAPNCSRELAWLEGMELQAAKFYTYQALREFKQGGRLQLTSLDGERACGPWGADLMRAQTIMDNLVKELVAKVGENEAAALRCEQRGPAAEVTSHAPCRLELSQQHLAMLWARVIRCEGYVRAKNDLLFERFRDPASLVDNAQRTLEPICKSDPYNVDCRACRNSTRSRRFKRCYKEELPKYLREQIRDLDTRRLEAELFSKADEETNRPVHADAFLWALGSLAGALRKKKRLKRSQARAPSFRQTVRYLFRASVIVILAFGPGCNCTGEIEGGGAIPPDQDPCQSFNPEQAELCEQNPNANESCNSQLGLKEICDPDAASVDGNIISDAGGAAGDVGAVEDNAREVAKEFGLDGIEAPRAPAGQSELAATAVDAPLGLGGGSRSGKSGGGGDVGPGDVSVNLPKTKFLEQGSGGAGSASTGVGGLPDGTAESAATAQTLAEGPTEIADAAPGYESAGAAGPAKPGAQKFGGFSSDSGGPAVGSAEGTNFGTDGTGGLTGDLEGYLARVGRLSLFEIINRRTDRFSTTLHQKSSVEDFNELTQ